MKLIYCKSKADFIESAGRDWYKIVKVDGGYIGFDNRTEYNVWRKQK